MRKLNTIDARNVKTNKPEKGAIGPGSQAKDNQSITNKMNISCVNYSSKFETILGNTGSTNSYQLIKLCYSLLINMPSDNKDESVYKVICGTLELEFQRLLQNAVNKVIDITTIIEMIEFMVTHFKKFGVEYISLIDSSIIAIFEIYGISESKETNDVRVFLECIARSFSDSNFVWPSSKI